jgi:hypothetical protein
MENSKKWEMLKSKILEKSPHGINAKNLEEMKETYIKYRFDEGFNTIGKLNLSAWLGERAHFLLIEIEQLQEMNKNLELAIKRLEEGMIK